MVLRSVAGFGALSVPGLVVGGAVTILGLANAGAGEYRADRVGGLLTAAAGALTVAASLPVVGGVASTLMWLGGLGFVGFGIVSAAGFLRGLRTRR